MRLKYYVFLGINVPLDLECYFRAYIGKTIVRRLSSLQEPGLRCAPCFFPAMENHSANTATQNSWDPTGPVRRSEDNLSTSTDSHALIGSGEQTNNNARPARDVRPTLPNERTPVSRVVPRSRLDMAILSIKPMNYAAKESFDDIASDAVYKDLNAHHQSFVVRTGKTTERVGSTQKEFIEGHYCIRTSSACVHPSSFCFILGSGMGRADRGGHRVVDILTARPGGPQFEATESSSCAICMTGETGAWGVHALSRSVLPNKVNNKEIAKSTFCWLGQGLSVLEVGSLAYWVEFEIRTIEQEDLYVEARNNHLLPEEQKTSCATISGIPIDGIPCAKRDRNQLRHGEAASAYMDCHPVIGRLIIHKTLHIFDEPTFRSAEAEMGVLKNPKSVSPPHTVLNSLGGCELIP